MRAAKLGILGAWTSDDDVDLWKPLTGRIGLLPGATERIDEAGNNRTTAVIHEDDDVDDQAGLLVGLDFTVFFRQLTLFTPTTAATGHAVEPAGLSSVDILEVYVHTDTRASMHVVGVSVCCAWRRCQL